MSTTDNILRSFNIERSDIKELWATPRFGTIAVPADRYKEYYDTIDRQAAEIEELLVALEAVTGLIKNNYSHNIKGTKMLAVLAKHRPEWQEHVEETLTDQERIDMIFKEKFITVKNFRHAVDISKHQSPKYIPKGAEYKIMGTIVDENSEVTYLQEGCSFDIPIKHLVRLQEDKWK